MSMERYPFEKAWDEAHEMKKKVEKGQARDYGHAERLVEMEAAVDTRLEEVMRRHMRKINQGNAGVIMRMNFDDIPEEISAWLGEQGFEMKENQVAKILKFYHLGDAEREFGIQKKAFEAMEKSGDPSAASVPKPYFYREVSITPETQEALKGMGVKSSEKVGVIMMDYVQGEDLATKLFKEVIKRHPKLVDLLDGQGELLKDLREAPFDKLPLDRIAAALDYRAAKLTNQRPSPEEVAAAQERVFNENEAKLLTFLKDSDFRLHPAIVKQVESAMRILHENGIVFRDGHQRNFMIDGDMAWNGEKTPPPKVTVIDFGGSATFEGDYEAKKDELYYDASLGKGYRDDLTAVRLLRPLTLSKSAGGFEAEFGGKVAARREMMSKHLKFQELLKEILARPGDVDLADVHRRLPGQGALKLENFLAASLEILDRGRVGSAALRAYAEGPLLAENPGAEKQIRAFLTMF